MIEKPTPEQLKLLERLFYVLEDIRLHNRNLTNASDSIKQRIDFPLVIHLVDSIVTILEEDCR